MAPAGLWCFDWLALELGDALMSVFAEAKLSYGVNWAAQDGVLCCLNTPSVYMQSDLADIVQLLEICCHHGFKN